MGIIGRVGLVAVIFAIQYWRGGELLETLLVAVSLDAFDTDDLDRWRAEEARADEAFDALNRRISAGVSVAF